MSVLSFPRVYFTGYMAWDPATGNNNDYFPTYDSAHSEMNWQFLNPQGITQANYKQTFLPWMTNTQTINVDGESTTGIPGEWNYFGGNGCQFVQYKDKRSLINGGALQFGNSIESGDPLIGKPVVLAGNPFGDPSKFSPGRLVDVNPVSSYTSQIYFSNFTIGDAKTHVQGSRAFRMYSRFANYQRNSGLPVAGGMSVIWQTCIPRDQLVFSNAQNSKLLDALKQALAAPGAQGLMIRFCSYLNLYMQNGIFNDFTPQPRSSDDLPPLYQKALNNQIDFFENPCYSQIVGAVGVWKQSEPASVPSGRYLVCQQSVHPQGTAPTAHAAPPASRRLVNRAPGTRDAGSALPAPPKPVLLGAAVAEVDYANRVLSLDLSNTMPEHGPTGVKADFGPVKVGVMTGSQFTPIAEIPYNGYDQTAYKRSAGIVDLQFSPQDADKIRNGQLALQVTADPGKTAMAEQALSAQTDQRGIYIEEGEEKTVQIALRQGGAPVQGVKVLIAKFDADQNVVPATATDQYVQFTSGQIMKVTAQGTTPVETTVTVVESDATGTALVKIKSASPGFPILFFYPYLPTAAQPVPTSEVSGLALGTGYFTVCRVMPFDNALVGQFINLWNSTYDPDQAWQFVFNNVLRVYDMIYAVMLPIVPLNDRQRVEGAIDQLLMLVSKTYAMESTIAMPITRDLSAGKRLILELWGSLVKRAYPRVSLSNPL